MRWGILSDIHANYESLTAVLVALKKERIDKYLCLGDIVGYGADPGACIAEIKRLNSLTIAGNHDWASVNLFDISHFNPTALRAVLWTRKQLAEGDRQFLKNLELIYQEDKATFVHGSLKDPEGFGYILEPSGAKETFKLLQTKICFIGHSHAPVTFAKEGENYTASFKAKLKLRASRTYIVNAGSVGQPRDGNPQAAYVVYDSETDEVQTKRVAYDIQKAQDKIIKAGLPRVLAERLSVGR